MVLTFLLRCLFIAWLALGAFGCFEPASAMPSKVQIRLFEAHPGLKTLQIEGAFRILHPRALSVPSGRYRLTTNSAGMLLTQSSGGSPLWKGSRVAIKTLSKSPLTLTVKDLSPRLYSGLLTVSLQPDGSLRLIDEVPLLTYVTLVVGSETPPNWPLEALKAQAVLTQTRLSRYHLGDTLGDSTQQEAFWGEAYRKPDVEKAVQSVWGQTLTWQGRPITPFYHAACSGGTSDARFFGGKRSLPYLRAVPCHACRLSPFQKPTVRTVTGQAFSKVFGNAFPHVLQRDEAGRPLRFKMENGQTLSGYALWLCLGQIWGWDKVPGTRFTLTKTPAGNVEITSRGAGHGVGLCQWGAAALARSGKSYGEILYTYFPGTRLALPSTSAHPAQSGL